jgi:uncharacterized delta-60 repeat protein
MAVSGDLDLGFGGGDGIVFEDFVQSSWGMAITMLGCCKIVAVGQVGTVGAGGRDIAVIRYALDGSRDVGFGSNGEVFTDFGGEDFARDVAIQADRKIVAGGGGGLGQDFAIARYNVNGSLDVSFGVGGLVLTDFGGNDVIRGLAIQRDGKIVAAGFRYPSPSDFLLARYNTDGSLDPSFGVGGLVTSNLAGNDLVRGVALQNDGRIVVVGYSNYDFAVARYLTDGSPDPTFGLDGWVTTDFGALDICRAVAIQRDGRILLAGYTGTGGGAPARSNDDDPMQEELGDFAMARYNVDGSLDASFGAGGTVVTVTEAVAEHARGVAIQRDGRIVLAGSTEAPAAGQSIFDRRPGDAASTPSDFATARYEPDGSLDPTFGVNGWAITPVGGDDGARDIAIQRDGKLVEVGIMSGANGYQFALVRYLAA